MPPKPSAKKPIRDEQLHMLISADERRDYDECAAEADVPLSRWIRGVLKREVDRQRARRAKT